MMMYYFVDPDILFLAVSAFVAILFICVFLLCFDAWSKVLDVLLFCFG